MRLIQFIDQGDRRAVGLVDEAGATAAVLEDVQRVYDLALAAHRSGRPLHELARSAAGTRRVSLGDLVERRRLLVPLDHPDPAHCLVTGTGLSHLGSAAARDAMHAKIAADESELTDSMKMFKWGVQGGKPAAGETGVQPEWFYKGDARWLVHPEHPLPSPVFALDGGEEAEVVGLYLIGDEGEPLRIGYALGNEFSDHVMERQNYLYLAHSKLRASSFGPELLLGELPASLHGRAALVRGGKVVWSGEFDSGDDNMAHSVANLEAHHFKYRQFRQPGDVHIHFLGAATGSFTAGVKAEPGDVFEISAALFGLPLRNALAVEGGAAGVVPRTL